MLPNQIDETVSSDDVELENQGSDSEQYGEDELLQQVSGPQYIGKDRKMSWDVYSPPRKRNIRTR